MRVLFIFLDGIGLGNDDPEVNPFARAQMPQTRALLGGQRLLASSAPFEGPAATLLSLDASLGVAGLPQSATGQAVLLTGVNVPAEIGEHYGPKPNALIARRLQNGNIFTRLGAAGRSAALLNAYPPRYFHGVQSGHRLYSSIPLAVVSAGLSLFDKDHLFSGSAMSADFTGAGWVSMLGFPDAPVLSAAAAGRRLAELAGRYDFSLFEYWATDYAGHKQDMRWAVDQLEVFDSVLGELVASWDSAAGLILITSDHGNMEDLTTRRHTGARVPAIVVGGLSARRNFSRGLNDLTGIAPAILDALGVLPILSPD